MRAHTCTRTHIHTHVHIHNLHNTEEKYSKNNQFFVRDWIVLIFLFVLLSCHFKWFLNNSSCFGKIKCYFANKKEHGKCMVFTR